MIQAERDIEILFLMTYVTHYNKNQIAFRHTVNLILPIAFLDTVCAPHHRGLTLKSYLKGTPPPPF